MIQSRIHLDKLQKGTWGIVEDDSGLCCLPKGKSGLKDATSRQTAILKVIQRYAM